MPDADIHMQAGHLPTLRGRLAIPSKTDGRFDMPLLCVVNARGDVEAADIDAAAEAFLAGHSKVSVSNLGTVERLNPPAGDLSGQVAIVTGGAGGLGLSVAEELVSRGAKVALWDIAKEPVRAAADRLGGIGITCDVTDPAKVEAAVQDVVNAFGGVDILISNAGSAQQGSLLELEDTQFHKAFDLNFWSHHYVARAVVRVMKAQGTGGALVFNVSKQAVNPGPNFGAYGAPKAALMALMRQYAVEHGGDGITANAVNADRIRTGLMTDEMIEARSQARGLTADEYMRGNLVKREVTGKDVAEAFVFLARARTSTGAVMTVDGGNVAAMMR
ncbi:MAG: SDR family oxidoreductase [Paracoccaceae bacterium]